MAMIDIERRIELLGGVSTLAAIHDEAAMEIADRFEVVEVADGTTVIEEGTAPRGFFIIDEGQVEITQQGKSGPIVLNTLGAGASFGEASFLDDAQTTIASVTATRPSRFLFMSPDDFRSVLADYTDVLDAFQQDVDSLLRANLLAHAGPLAKLSSDTRKRMLDRVETYDLKAGDILVTQGEPGKGCYALATGKAEVLLERSDGTTQKLAELGPGSLIGEAALLTEAPRNATVRMTEPGRALGISREALLEAVERDDRLKGEIVSLLRMRFRPVQRPNVSAHERKTPDGSTISVLKDETRGAYYRLAEDGRFIWDRLDGKHTPRDLAVEWFAESKEFAPEKIATSLNRLIREGFALAPALKADVEEDSEPSFADRVMGRALDILTAEKALEGVDAVFAKTYRIIGKGIYNPITITLFAAVALGGIVAWFIGGPRSPQFLVDAGVGPFILLFLIPANAVAGVLHEFAHALTVKHFGREVNRAGVGWHYIAPVMFVDTSDMWLESRTARSLVSLAGPFTDVVVGSVAAFAALAIDQPLLAALAWQWSLTSYYIALLNFNPLLEFDGYHVLTDVLDRPNLRSDALQWFGSELLPTLRNPARFKGHLVDFVYGTLSLLYILMVGFFVLVVYRVLIASFVADVIGTVAADALSWLLAAVAVGLLILGLVAQMRGGKAPSH